jgi:hypothetical protein
MKQLLLIPLIALGAQLPALADTIAPGMNIEVRADNPIEVAKWDHGRIYTGHVARDVVARDGNVAIPRGANAEMIVRQIGPDQLVLDLESITVNGRRYVMDASGPQFNAARADYDRGAGLVGSIIGAIAGVDTRGGEIRVPAGSMLNFQLQQPLHVVDWNDPGYTNNGFHYHHEHDWYR